MRQNILVIVLLGVVAAIGCDRRTSRAEARVHRDPPGGEATALPTPGSSSPSPPETSSPSRGSTSLEAKGFRRYGLRSGVVEYRIRGSLEGRELLYFDRFGLREAKYTETDLVVLGSSEKSRELTLLDGAWMTKIDLDTKNGQRGLDPTYDTVVPASEGRDLTNLAEGILRDMGGRRIGTELHLGRECDVWELPAIRGRTWIWNGIALRTELNGPDGSLVHEAVRLDADASVPEDVFEIPDGVDVRLVTPTAPAN